MKHRLGILFLLLSLFALSANRAWACGDTDAGHVAKFHHEHSHDSVAHKHETAHSHRANSSDNYSQDQPDQPCSDDESGHCHCPGCGAVCHAPAAFAPADVAVLTSLLCDASMQRQAFYFAQHLPEAVYLPIWQPPKLVA